MTCAEKRAFGCPTVIHPKKLVLSELSVAFHPQYFIVYKQKNVIVVENAIDPKMLTAIRLGNC